MRLGAVVTQAILALLGYVFAALAGATFATVAIANAGVAPVGTDWADLLDLTLDALDNTRAFFMDALVPSAGFIVLAELTRLRGLAYYLVAGCGIGLLVALPMVAMIETGTLPPIATERVQLAVASCAVGAFVYWLTAGRSAGMWIEGRASDARA